MRHQKNKIYTLLTVAISAVAIFVPLTVEAKLHDFLAGLALTPLAVFGKILATVMIFVMGLFIRLAAYVFDVGMTLTSALTNSNVVNTPWEFLRDMANLAFIFILLIIAIEKILGISKFSDNKTIVRLIIVALLINFSKAIALVIIDISQIISAYMFGEVFQGGSGGVSGRIMNALEAPKLFQLGDALGQAFSGGGAGALGNVTMSSFLVVIVMAAIAWFFIAGAIKLLTRLIWLMVLTAASPIIMLAWALPSYRSWAEKSFNKFIESAFFLPYFSFVIWLAVSAAETMKGALVVGQSGSVLVNNPIQGPLLAQMNKIGLNLTTGQLQTPDLQGIGGSFFANGNFFGPLVLIVILYAGMQSAGMASVATSNKIIGFGKKVTGVSAVEKFWKAQKKEGKKQKKEGKKVSLSSSLGAKFGRKKAQLGESIKARTSFTEKGKKGHQEEARRIDLQDRAVGLENRSQEELEEKIRNFEPEKPDSNESREAAAAALTYINDHVDRIDKDNPLTGLAKFGKYTSGEINKSKTARNYLLAMIEIRETNEPSPPQETTPETPPPSQPKVVTVKSDPSEKPTQIPTAVPTVETPRKVASAEELGRRRDASRYRQPTTKDPKENDWLREFAYKIRNAEEKINEPEEFRNYVTKDIMDHLNTSPIGGEGKEFTNRTQTQIKSRLKNKLDEPERERLLQVLNTTLINMAHEAENISMDEFQNMVE